jgi:hypothetical protein
LYLGDAEDDSLGKVGEAARRLRRCSSNSAKSQNIELGDRDRSWCSASTSCMSSSSIGAAHARAPIGCIAKGLIN